MNKGMFRGLKQVFSFTFAQNIKTKPFKIAVITISVLLFVAFFAINIGVGMYRDSKSKNKHGLDGDKAIEKLYFVNHTDISNFDIMGIKEVDEQIENLDIEILDDASLGIEASKIDEDTKIQETYHYIQQLIDEADKQEKVMSIVISENHEDNSYEIRVNQSENCKKSYVTRVVDDFELYFEETKYHLAGIDDVHMQLIMSDKMVTSSDIEEADKSLTELLLEIFVPMLTTLVMYMLILLHGQSISKTVVAEKNSKLMETLLISVKPYAVILGKVMAMYLIAILEMAAWAVSGIAGYLISDKVASLMFDHYKNPVASVIDLLKDNMNEAFGVSSVVVCVLAVLVGFLAYCVLSALISSNITKAEDMANGNGIYQVIVVIGFMLAYLLPLAQKDSIIVKFLRFIPITSAYMIPSDVLIGNMSLVASLISIGILLITTAVMVVITGKIYKKKVF